MKRTITAERALMPGNIKEASSYEIDPNMQLPRFAPDLVTDIRDAEPASLQVWPAFLHSSALLPTTTPDFRGPRVSCSVDVT
jgi:hypothetical protein